MSTIQDLEQKIRQLEQKIIKQQEDTKAVLTKSDRALDEALHAYRIDHAGYVWVWDPEKKHYRKTDVCVRVIIPKVKPKEITNIKIADKAVDNRTLDDDAVDARTIKNGSVKSEHIAERAVKGRLIGIGEIINELLARDAVQTDNIKDRNVTGEKIAKSAVGTEHMKNGSVTPEKASVDFKARVIEPFYGSLDRKYTNITNELYRMIASLQVGGIALSNQFGDREDIGISQKTLTKALGRFWQEMETITGQTYMDFTLTVVPVTTFSETSVAVSITADCSQAISNFDSIKIYVDDVLIAESSDVEVFNTVHNISQTSIVRAVGVILGKTITKTQQVVNEIPFFMGSGANYQDIMNMTCHKDLEGTLEGDYDVTVRGNGQYIFIIIPKSHKAEFRRADMNGYEIPLSQVAETGDYVAYQSANTYDAGTYNIDININS